MAPYLPADAWQGGLQHLLYHNHLSCPHDKQWINLLMIAALKFCTASTSLVRTVHCRLASKIVKVVRDVRGGEAFAKDGCGGCGAFLVSAQSDILTSCFYGCGTPSHRPPKMNPKVNTASTCGRKVAVAGPAVGIGRVETGCDLGRGIGENTRLSSQHSSLQLY